MRFLFLAALLLLKVAPSLAAEDCILYKAATLDIKESHGGIVVPVSINGSERKFLLDTGGAITALKRSAIKDLGLSEFGHDKVFTIKGEQSVGFVLVAELGFGISKGKNFRLHVFPDDFLPSDVDGILSPNLLRNFDLDFDFGARVLNLMSPQHCKGKVVYWTLDFAAIPFSLTENGHISIPVTLDGKPLTAVVDTGASRTVLGSGPAKNKFGLTDSSEGNEVVDLGPKSVIRYRKYFKTLSLEGLDVNNPLIYVRSRAMEDAMDESIDAKLRGNPQSSEPDFEKIDLLIGMSILSRLHMYVAYKEKMLYVSGANAVPIGAVSSTPAAAPSAP